MNKRMKKIIQLFGYCMAISQGVVLYALFLSAWLNSSNTVVVTIYRMNEALIEFIVLPVSLAISILGLYYLIREVFE